jgi:hypothetical protein
MQHRYSTDWQNRTNRTRRHKPISLNHAFRSGGSCCVLDPKRVFAGEAADDVAHELVNGRP